MGPASKERDRRLGMHRQISRRDFVHGAGLAALGLSMARCSPAREERYYPPTLTGMRGSHDGSFEVAHALAREGKSFAAGQEVDDPYDLIVVGGGISGLAAAYYYRKLHGPGSRILILDNHDDFGGHAKRNEFHQGGPMRLVWGGVFNLEYPMFSDTVNALMAELGVDIPRLARQTDFNYGDDGRLGQATYFDAESYGRDVLLPGFALRHGDPAQVREQIGRVPLDEESVESLKRFYAMREDVLAGKSPEERRRYLRDVSYTEFLRRHGGLTEAAAGIFVNTTHGYAGVGADSLSVDECSGAGLPMEHLLGGELSTPDGSVGGEVAMFPDGNASIARMLVRELIDGVAPGRGMDDVATAEFDYSKLDLASSPVRLRLGSTAVRVVERDGEVRVSYVRGGKSYVARGRDCVLACYHAIVPFLCPELPQAQQEAMRHQVKRPLLLTNVMLRNSAAADRLGVSGAYCPGRMHGATWLVKGIESDGYRHPWDDPGPVVMQFWGSLAPPVTEVDARTQHRLSRALLLEMPFEDFEREVRVVLDGMLGPGGFDAAGDILAITVNRWPHGYACGYLDLWDPDYPAGEAPHEIARRPFGRIAMANSDAGASAYTHVAIDEAWRAVNELA